VLTKKDGKQDAELDDENETKCHGQKGSGVPNHVSRDWICRLRHWEDGVKSEIEICCRFLT